MSSVVMHFVFHYTGPISILTTCLVLALNRERYSDESKEKIHVKSILSLLKCLNA